MQKKKRIRWTTGTVLAAALLAVMAALLLWRQPAPQSGQEASMASAAAGGRATDAGHTSTPVPVGLWRVDFPDLAGKRQALSQWKGKVLVVNFWATWCPPCRAEIPDFIHEQGKYRKQGLQFVGIAVDDPDAVKAFAKEFGINYPVLQAETGGMELAEAMGNVSQVLPYTLVIDRKGNVVASAAGMLDPDKFGQLIRPMLGS